MEILIQFFEGFQNAFWYAVGVKFIQVQIVRMVCMKWCSKSYFYELIWILPNKIPKAAFIFWKPRKNRITSSTYISIPSALKSRKSKLLTWSQGRKTLMLCIKIWHLLIHLTSKKARKLPNSQSNYLIKQTKQKIIKSLPKKHLKNSIY